ncbi:MAG: DUF2236 domain-containing protein [Actinobacteria bacterium]|nr:MAG: DUF2236 domain-containing protein [Actinomycetota bacterium]
MSVERAIEPVRIEIQLLVRSFVTGSPSPPKRLSDPDDPGLFEPDSAIWRVHADVSMFIGGLRALLLQTLHEPTMTGVAEHSDYRHEPLGRHRSGAPHPRSSGGHLGRRHSLCRQRSATARVGARDRSRQLSPRVSALCHAAPRCDPGRPVRRRDGRGRRVDGRRESAHRSRLVARDAAQLSARTARHPTHA